MSLCRALTPAVILVLTLVVPSAPAWAAEDQGADAMAPGLRDRLERIDKQMAKVHSLSANFTKRQTTVLLKKPLVSRGTVRMTEDYVRWDTTKPRESRTLIGGGEVRIFYPADNRMEVYPLDRRLARFGVGPMPRLSKLAKRFTLKRIDPAKVLDAKDDPVTDDDLALSLTPRDKALREHLKNLMLVLDTKAHALRALRLVQPDGSSSTYRLTDLKLNPEIDPGDLALHLPEGTEVVRPYDSKR